MINLSESFCTNDLENIRENMLFKIARNIKYYDASMDFYIKKKVFDTSNTEKISFEVYQMAIFSIEEKNRITIREIFKRARMLGR